MADPEGPLSGILDGVAPYRELRTHAAAVMAPPASHPSAVRRRREV